MLISLPLTQMTTGEKLQIMDIYGRIYAETRMTLLLLYGMRIF